MPRPEKSGAPSSVSTPIELDREKVLELKAILEKKHGHPFTEDQVTSMGRKLIQLVQLLAQIDTRVRAEELHKPRSSPDEGKHTHGTDANRRA